MSFESILRKIVDESGGGLGAVLMGTDGIAIEQVQARSAAGDAEAVSAAGVEFGRILEEIRKAADAIDGGPVQETVIGLARLWLIFRSVDRDNVLVVALAPEGNVGKARFLMRRHLPELREQL